MTDEVSGLPPPPPPPGKGEGEIRTRIIALESGDVAGVVKLLGR